MKKLLLLLLTVSCAAVMTAQNVNMTFRSNLAYPGQTCANIWGYVDTVGNEYALVGASQGLSIVDVTDPDNPFEVVQIPGPNNLWKEVKTWGKYAYVASEGGNGLQIINLSSLPALVTGSLPNTYWQPIINGNALNKIHALLIDNGKAYLYGGDLAPGGCVIADLSNPWNPTYLGRYSQNYIHDGYVRNDTLYGGHIYDGYFSVIDVSNPANITSASVLATQPTPGTFTHNTWLSDNSKVLFTTDEVSDSYLAAYDISDLNNITELDRIQSNPGSGSIVHNTHILNDWAVTSWYRDGVTIVDGNRPQNLVQVANYDTYAGSGDGFDGSWGVYPFLPSGNLVVSNIDEGLFVLTPTYVRGCYLEGVVMDSICGTPLSGVTVQIVSTGVSEQTGFTGDYKTGYHTPGNYTVTFSKPGYTTRTFTNVPLAAGIVNILNVQLYSPTALAVNGNVTNAATTTPVANIPVIITNSSNTYNFTTDASGNFSTCNVQPGTYTIIAGAWGYQETCTTQNITTGNSTVQLQLTARYYDDFSLDYGWTVSGPSGNMWEIAKPVATQDNNNTANPGVDVNNDCSDKAYVTDNGGGGPWDNDVDGGATILTSPVFDLSSYTNPVVHYFRWFYNGGFVNGPPNDTMKVMISNGASTVTLETLTASAASWQHKSFIISNSIPVTSTMRMIYYTADANPGNIVEGGVDLFYITDTIAGAGTAIPELAAGFGVKAFPNPFDGTVQVQYQLPAAAEAAAMIFTDITGREVRSIPVQGSQGVVVAGEGLSAGIYFVRLVSGSQHTEPIKLVKMK